MATRGIIRTAPQPQIRTPGKQHKVYPYRLRNQGIDSANPVGASDITYVPLAKGFAYRVVIIDWHSRKVLRWRLSNTREADFCVDALEVAIPN